MTPFTSLYRKEFREHSTSLFVVLGLAVLCWLLTFCFPEQEQDGLAGLSLVWYVYLYGFYVTAIAAMSYAKEEEAQTSRFLRTLPVSSGTILLAKLAWLGTVMLTLALPAVLVCFALFVRHGGSFFDIFETLYDGAEQLGILVSFFIATIFSLVSWGYFWTTRYPSKLFATIVSISCAFITWLILGWLALQMTMLFDGGQPGMKFYLSLAGGMFLASLPVAVLGFWRAAVFYDMAEPESKPEPFLNSERKGGDWRMRVITGLFPRDRWTPFQALLWQAICQSRDSLFLGLCTGVVVILWQIFCSSYFLYVMDAHVSIFSASVPLRDQAVAVLGVAVIAFAGLIVFGLGSSIFAQDQERGLYRALGQRGVSPRLVWWSRILPFLFVFLLPLPFVYMFTDAVYENPRDKDIIEPILLCAFYVVPFLFGMFYSLLFRNALLSILATAGTWILLWGGIAWNVGFLIQFCGFDITNTSMCVFFTVAAVVVLLFPIASRLMTARWLREEPWSRRWPVAALPLALFTLYVGTLPAIYWGYRMLAYAVFSL